MGDGMRRRWLAIGLALVAVAAIGACGGGGDDDADVAADATTTTADEDDDDEGGTGTTAAGSGGAEDPWRTTAMPHRREVGETFELDCPPGGEPGTIWGVETYTADSSICTAAVHVGLITFEEGGEVEYEIAAGLDEYGSATAHEVLSNRFGRFEGSFTFPDAPPGSGDFVLGPETWQRRATEYRGKTGEQVEVDCAPGGPIGAVWGTDTYTDDSSICTAAVHAGVITVAKGGKVTIEIADGRSSYEGSAANGVTSTDYGPFAGSFTFVET